MSRADRLFNGSQFKSSNCTTHESESLRDKKVNAVALLTASALPIVIPFIHLGIISLLWREYNYPVDQHTCTCSCWDTVFKGQYESGVAAYKHVYFNATSNTLKIWAVTVAYLLGLYEVARRTVTLAFRGRLRPSMLLLLLTVIYPHYYAWWSYFNYWNDDYYAQWYHQLFFTMTELVSTAVVVKLLDTKNTPQSRELLVILTIAVVHISASLYDQFISNVLRGEGRMHQVLRDLGLMFPDIVHFVVPWTELSKTLLPLRKLFVFRDLMVSAIFIIVSCIFIVVA